MAIVAFLAVILLVIVAIHLYLWKRLVRDTTTAGSVARGAGNLAVALLALAIPGTLIGSRVGPHWIAYGYLWLPVMFYLLLTLLAVEIPMLVARVWLRRRARHAGTDRPAGPAAPDRAADPDAGQPAPPAALERTTDPDGQRTPTPHGGRAADHDADQPARPTTPQRAADHDADQPARPTTRRPATDPDASAEAAPEQDGGRAATDHDPARRLLLARGAAIFAGLTATGITGYGMRTALGGPSIDRVRIPLAKLPRSMDGFRIGVVSDIHLGPLAGRSHAQRIVDTVNRLDADLVAIVGDLVDGSVEELGSAAEPLRGLRSRRGVFFVTGNHEYFSGVDQWLAELPDLGVRVLRNERLEVGALDLAGVDDVTAGEEGPGSGRASGSPAGPDYAAALGDRDPSRPVVLMAHQPVQAREAARYGVDLQLSGHTHGGQLAPFNLLVRAQQPIVSGIGRVDGTTVYVSNGAGFWGPPVRVGARPQVGLVELRSR